MDDVYDDPDKSTSSIKNHEVIVPVSLGMISDPPILILVYEVMTTSTTSRLDIRKKQKRRKRKMPLRNFSDKSDVSKFISMLQQRHSKVMNPIPYVTLEKVLRIIQEVQRGYSVDDAVRAIDKAYEDKSKNISTDELQSKNEIMSSNLIREDLEYPFDKETNFESDPRNKDIWEDKRDLYAHNSVDKETPLPTPVASNGSGDFALDASRSTTSRKGLHSNQTRSKSESEKQNSIVNDKDKGKENNTKEKDLDASIESEDFESEEEEIPVSTKDLSKTYDFKLKDDNYNDNDNEDIDNEDFWKF